MKKYRCHYNITKQVLQEKYKTKVPSQIAKYYNCSPSIIRYWLLKYNIKMRTRSEAKKNKFNPMYGKKRNHKGKNNPMYGKKRQHTLETKLKISKSNRGKNNPFYGHLLKPNWRIYKGILMRSSWEIQVAKHFDKLHISYKYEPKTFDLENTTYTPDFYLPVTDTYIEIKGYISKLFEKKINKFINLYPNIKIEVWTEKLLINLGIISSNWRQENRIKYE